MRLTIGPVNITGLAIVSRLEKDGNFEFEVTNEHGYRGFLVVSRIEMDRMNGHHSINESKSSSHKFPTERTSDVLKKEG
jgi:hypothetical protein